MYNLGILLAGEHGINLLKHALEIEKGVYGEDHPKFVGTLIALSSLYRDLGDLLKAKKMAQDALFFLRNFINPPCK